MGFFARGGEQDGEQSEALARIEAGGIPRRAEERLKALGAGGSLFTSGLSVNEFALLGRLGPIRNYMRYATVVCELDTLTDAWNLARRRALDRLTEEALQVGADAVVGVRLHRSDHDLGPGTIEYVVRGRSGCLARTARHGRS